MFFSRFLPILIVIGVTGPVLAIQFASGETAFNGAPKLLRAAVTDTSFEAYPVYYQFTVELPAKLDEPLGQLRIEIPNEYGVFGLRPPNPKDVRAFLPTEPNAQAPQYAAKFLATKVTVQGQTVALSFDPPVPPGNVVTVEWGPLRNPTQDGTYLYDVTAYPAGAMPRAQTVGYGRITIRQNFGSH
ncbi:MAG: DUF2808 domain-containing protein [Anaerolineae bacterium]|nr:DUF2808 domain-containing protein [Gloeobacterales cyanobacterium ES-bin-313]